MAMAASLALGTLSILAGQATALKPNVFDIEPKALWGLCMYTAYTSGLMHSLVLCVSLPVQLSVYGLKNEK
jgi:hypothetical protein